MRMQITFFQCYFARHVWFHMGQWQQYMAQWNSITDVIHFALALPKITRTAFLIVVSTTIWCIWRHQNDLCFNDSITHSDRQGNSPHISKWKLMNDCLKIWMKSPPGCCLWWWPGGDKDAREVDHFIEFALKNCSFVLLYPSPDVA